MLRMLLYTQFILLALLLLFRSYFFLLSFVFSIFTAVFVCLLFFEMSAHKRKVLSSSSFVWRMTLTLDYTVGKFVSDLRSARSRAREHSHVSHLHTFRSSTEACRMTLRCIVMRIKWHLFTFIFSADKKLPLCIQECMRVRG